MQALVDKRKRRRDFLFQSLTIFKSYFEVLFSEATRQVHVLTTTSPCINGAVARYSPIANNDTPAQPAHPPLPGFEEAVAAAEKGAEATCHMGALAGRANYVAEESLKGVPDPGAKAAAYALKAISGALS